MRVDAARRVLGLSFGGILVGCSALIGTRDLIYDADAGSATDGGGSIDGAGSDGNAGDGGGPTDGGADGATCGDTMSSATNCGRCGHDCLGGSCQTGVCAPVKINGDGGGQPWAIAADDTNVYYSDIGGADGGVVWRLQKDGGGGGPTQIATTTDKLVYDLQIDAQRVYFSSGSNGNGGAVEMVPLGGGAKVTITQNGPGAADPRGVTVDASHVYWVNTNTPTNVQRANMAAAQTPTSLATSENDPTFAYVDKSGNILWWNDKSGGKIRRCTLPNCALDKGDLVTGIASPDFLTGNNSRLFFNSDTTVFQIAKSVPAGVNGVAGPVAKNQSLPIAIAVDEQEIYWIDLGDYMKSFIDGEIRRCPVLNGAADCTSTPSGEGEVIAKPGGAMARGIAIDPTAVYWTEQESGSVWRLAR